MRIAKCINDLHITVTGSNGSVSIAQGWEGDLDQVIGERVIAAKRDAEDPSKILAPEQRIPETIADHLGQHFTEANFVVARPPNLKGPGRASNTAAQPPKE